MSIKQKCALKLPKISSSYGFTIVELLIVIVIIGILAAITIVSYTGITGKATIAAVQADLANASKKINMYYALYGAYPTSMPNDGNGGYCPSAPASDINYCIKPSSGTFTYTPTGNPATDFSLRIDSGTLVYNITKDSQPTNIATTPITAISAITGAAQVGQALTAGAITPGDATVTYQWQSSATAGGAYANIAGATSNIFSITLEQVGKYVRLAVLGNGSYSSAQISAATPIITDSSWITIGTQTWARANLNTGVQLINPTRQTDNSVVEKYCYNEDAANCLAYGGMYNWNEMMKYTNTEGAQGICPTGSHIPSDNDMKILEIQIGMTQEQADLDNIWRGIDQGVRLRVGGSSGLDIPFGGYRFPDGLYVNVNTDILLYTSSQVGSYRRLNYGNPGINRYADRSYSAYVRCLIN